MADPDYSLLLSLAPDDAWRRAVEVARRDLFIPAVAAAEGLLDRGRNPAEWWAAVTGDTSIVTQVDDGRGELSEPGRPSSSNTLPSLVFEFLRLLDPYPGDRVLEVGTGTGWTAGLLSARLGAESVTSVEVDVTVAARAKTNLERAGFTPTLVVGDGADGYPPGAPYDRVHVTCGVREVPYAWVDQTRPGGVIVLPWLPNHVRGHTVVLSVADGRAVGTIRGESSYMMLRSQRDDPVPPSGDVRTTAPRVDPRRIAHAGDGFMVALAAFAPGLFVSDAAPSGEIRLRHTPSGSYATTRHTDDGLLVVEQGSRMVWTALEGAYLEWVRLGSPDADRFGLAVDSAGSQIWLDTPENRLTEIPQWASTKKK